MAGQQGEPGAGADPAPGAAGEQAGFLQVQTTTDSRAEAMELARDAVRARLAACAQVTGPVMSTFWWEGDLERAEEWLLLFKLPAAGYQELATFLAERHSYDEPEIIAVPIVAGSPGYLGWMAEESRPR
jgi:periplasmic divalent cation tolerance protein